MSKCNTRIGRRVLFGIAIGAVMHKVSNIILTVLREFQTLLVKSSRRTQNSVLSLSKSSLKASIFNGNYIYALSNYQCRLFIQFICCTKFYIASIIKNLLSPIVFYYLVLIKEPIRSHFSNYSPYTASFFFVFYNP